jgi:hypothetical protein
MLPDNWLVIDPQDFEHKQYLLLDFLKKGDLEFKEFKLYPYLGEAIKHYTNLIHFKNNKEKLKSSFPKELIGIDFESMTLVYQELLDIPNDLDLVDDLVDYSLPKLNRLIKIGVGLYDKIENDINMVEFGVGLNQDCGYLFLNNSDILVYQYELSKIKDHTGSSILKTKLTKTYPKSNASTYTAIKDDITRHSEWVKPTTYIVDCELDYPINEAVLPIVKRGLIRTLLQHQK